jgi:hypothetical protein
MWERVPAEVAVAEERRVAEGGWPFRLLGDEPGDTWFFIDGEEMAEGQSPRELAELGPALRRYGIELRVEHVRRPMGVEDEDHVISINGRECVMWSPGDWVGYHAWETASVRPLAVINELLAEAGAVERLFTLHIGGNDGVALLIDPRLVAAAEATGLFDEVPRLAV